MVALYIIPPNHAFRLGLQTGTLMKEEAYGNQEVAGEGHGCCEKVDRPMKVTCGMGNIWACTDQVRRTEKG